MKRNSTGAKAASCKKSKPNADSTVALTLTTAGATSVEMQLPITATVLKVKRAVEREEGIAPSLQRVYSSERDTELRNKQRLSELGIDGTESITLTLVLKPGKYTLDVSLPDYTCHRTFATAKEAAAAAWQVCKEKELQLPSEEWQINHPRYGWQSTYNLMVPAGDNWEPEEVFQKYIRRRAHQKDGVALEDGGSTIKVFPCNQSVMTNDSQ